VRRQRPKDDGPNVRVRTRRPATLLRMRPDASRATENADQRAISRSHSFDMFARIPSRASDARTFAISDARLGRRTFRPDLTRITEPVTASSTPHFWFPSPGLSFCHACSPVLRRWIRATGPRASCPKSAPSSVHVGESRRVHSRARACRNSTSRRPLTT